MKRDGFLQTEKMTPNLLYIVLWLHQKEIRNKILLPNNLHITVRYSLIFLKSTTSLATKTASSIYLPPRKHSTKWIWSHPRPSIVYWKAPKDNKILVFDSVIKGAL